MHVARVELAKFRKTRCLLHLAHAARAIDELGTADARESHRHLIKFCCATTWMRALRGDTIP